MVLKKRVTRRVTIPILLVNFFLSTTIFAQQAGYSAEKDTIRDNDIVVPEMLNSEIDLSLVSWFGEKLLQEIDCSNQTFGTAPVTDQDYIDRLAKLPTVMEMPYNQIVRSYINLYAERRRQVSSMLGLSKFYFPIFEEELAKNGMPIELKYLPIIESALNPVALSRAGASGLWQFMYSTGKIYDLEVDSFMDERRDPIKSTKSAVRYLNDLYGIYQDWHLAIAAYNCGPGNVNKAIRRANGKKDYWAIYNFLPKETRGYVPAFIAATYIMNYYNDHQICPAATKLSLVTDTVHVDKMMHFEQIAQILAVSVEDIRALNPQYKLDIIPGNVSRQVLRLPMEAALAFHCNSDSICSYRADDFLVNSRRTVDVGGVYSSSGNNKLVTHRVKKGETMARVANRYGVTVAEVKKWNKLKSNTLKVGQRLKIYTPVSDSSHNVAQNTNSTSSQGGNTDTENKSIAELALNSSPGGQNSNTEASSSATTAPASKSTASATKAATKSYRVKKGDTLSGISKKMGVSVDKIKRANNISDSKIRIGQVLKIPQG
ncbi:MAG: LysM peptidoglycan-binding domain-containing protein [Candidatus Azobacteroides sp.]|nr:LysM peptidoglycan-binding domain-containing protein [Candidatus Azobacteroides sp.]